MTGGIPHTVRAFIGNCIKSVGQLEVLLALHAEPKRGWTVHEVSDRLRTSEAAAAEQLHQLESHDLANRVGDSPATYQYAPRDEETARAVRDTADAYARRRVSVISLIYANPNEKLRSFSNAFKLREDER